MEKCGIPARQRVTFFRGARKRSVEGDLGRVFDEEMRGEYVMRGAYVMRSRGRGVLIVEQSTEGEKLREGEKDSRKSGLYKKD